MQLRRLKEVKLQKVVRTQQPNGTYLETYSDIGSYKVIAQELNDEVSASIYGASIRNLLRIISIRNELENFLKPKLDNSNDNVSYYSILLNNRRYKIVSVMEKWVDISL